MLNGIKHNIAFALYALPAYGMTAHGYASSVAITGKPEIAAAATIPPN